MTFLPFLLALAQVPGSPPAPDAVLARIGTTEVKASELSPFLWEWYGQPALQEYVAFKLIEGEAKKRGLDADPKAVDEAIAKQVDEFKNTLEAGQNLEQAMFERGISRSRIRQRVVSDILLTKMAEAEFRPQDYIKASTIVVRIVGEGETGIQAAMVKAKSAYDRLKKGEAWDVVLKATTDDPTYLRNNGQLDWVAVSAFPDEVQAQLKSLEAGGITTPAKTVYGIQIFRVDKAGGAATAEELAGLKSRAVVQLRATLFEKLYRQVKIEPVK